MWNRPLFLLIVKDKYAFSFRFLSSFLSASLLKLLSLGKFCIKRLCNRFALVYYATIRCMAFGVLHLLAFIPDFEILACTIHLWCSFPSVSGLEIQLFL